MSNLIKMHGMNNLKDLVWRSCRFACCLLAQKSIIKIQRTQEITRCEWQ